MRIRIAFLFIIFYLVVFSSPSLAEERGPGGTRPRAKKFYENSWALLIGINNYVEPTIPDLQYSISDVDAMEELLQELGFPKKNICVLKNKKAKKVY